MGNRNWRGITVKIDNEAGVLTDITSSINQVSIEGVLNLLEDSSLADSESSYLPGLAGATAPLNGFVNGTTEPIFGPLVGKYTSVTKTLQVYNGLKYYTGEVYLNDLTWSGNTNELQTWSVDSTFDGPVTRSSVGL